MNVPDADMKGKNAVDQWKEILGMLREEAYTAIDTNPEVLLSGPGGSGGVTAHATFARLLGPDDQVIDDWRIQREVPELFVPIPNRPTVVMAGGVDCFGPPLLTRARYVCWSGHCVIPVTPEFLPPDIQYDFTTRQATLLFLRYKHDRNIRR